MEKYTVMIVYGGEGYESEISRSSASFFERIADDGRLSPIFAYVSRDGRWYLTRGARVDDGGLKPMTLTRGGLVADGRYIKIDIALPVMHGDRGEDGYISACLSHFKIKCPGSPYYTASLVRDKAAVKLFARWLGVETADFTCYPEGVIPTESELSAVVRTLGFPLFAKPRRLGSSVGASRAENMAELSAAVRGAALPHGGGVLIERAVKCELEAECGFIEGVEGGRFAVGAVLTGGREYSFERKYCGEDNISAVDRYPRSDSEREEIIKRSRRLVSALGIKTMCRVDFLVTAEGEILFNEINLVPGFTEDSLFPRLFFGEKNAISDFICTLARQASIPDR